MKMKDFNQPITLYIIQHMYAVVVLLGKYINNEMYYRMWLLSACYLRIFILGIRPFNFKDDAVVLVLTLPLFIKSSVEGSFPTCYR